MKNRDAFLDTIDRKLGKRKLIWFGARGEDAQPLLAIPQFSEVFSLIAPFGSVSVEVDACLETMRQSRMDLDTYSLDADHSSQAQALRRCLLESLKSSAAILPYRPLGFLSSVYYPRRGHVKYLGLFHERQAPFEHKPWVESELRDLGLRTLPWRYFSDEDRQRFEDELEALGSLVLRTNRSDGGAGLSLIQSKADLELHWHGHSDGFFAAAPHLVPHVPLNVNACVFPDGQVTLHGPSIQLIGIAECTQRLFGYCGNDFAAVRYIDDGHLNDLDEMVRTVGRWLASKGYIGAFGVDAMISGGSVYLTEVNPRFQGSSTLSALLDEELERADVFLAHIGAFFNLSPQKSESLCEIARLQSPSAQIICHNIMPINCRLEPGGRLAVSGGHLYLVPAPAIEIEKEAILFKVIVRKGVTKDGLSLSRSSRELIGTFAKANFSPAPATAVGAMS